MTSISEAKTGSGDKESATEKLKAAVSGKPDAAATSSEGGRVMLPVLFRKPPTGLDMRSLGLAGAALAIGTLLGAGTTALAHRDDGARTLLADTQAGLEAGRVEASRLNGEIESMNRTLTALRTTSDAVRNDIRSRETALTERMAKLEQSMAAKLATLGEHVDQGARDQAGRIAALTAQIEKRTAPAPVAAAAPVVAQPAPVAAVQPKPEPAQTGAIPDTKKAAEKPPVVEGWALRDVYDGTAVLEDRRRRLFEAVIGENVPGVGRVEAIEKRGREWVVVTRQGVITSQTW